MLVALGVVGAAFAAGEVHAAQLVHWAVPPMSNEMRLPDEEPTDGVKGGALRVVACRDEFEPASFVMKSDAEVGKFLPVARDLRTEDGHVLKAADIDLKVIKVWYQNGNCWYSYFNDTGLRLCPELLLNDETLIKVDEERVANYVRIDYKGGSVYRWVTPPAEIDPSFRKLSEPVSDAKTLQPAKLEKNRCKQFWVTFRIARNQEPGLYRGAIDLMADGRKAGEIPVRLRVLPYVLPDPKTYYDTSADFYTMLYCVNGVKELMAGNGADEKAAYEKLRRRLQNQVDHNVKYPLYFGLWKGWDGYDRVAKSLAIAKEVGMKLDPLFEAWSCEGGAQPYDGWGRGYFERRRQAEICKEAYGKILGHNNLYPAGGEEPGLGRILNSRNGWRSAHEAGQLVLCNGQDRRNYCGYQDDFRVGGGFADRRESDFMHRIKGKIGNYAGPHTGPENPDYMRRMHGINLYKKDYDMMYNYGYIEGDWNDLRSYCYRITLVYETKDGYIDTIPWEGIREGLDDIRYATLLMTLAERAVAEGKQKDVKKYYTGRKALQFLANVDEEKCDLNAVRLEMIRHIEEVSHVL